MKPYIYGPRNGIYIINLDVTKKLLDKACNFISDQVRSGGEILFVGTKRQAQGIINEEAKRCGMFYVDHRWLGGMLTNFQTLKNSIDRLKSIESMQADGSINRFPKNEILLMEKERIKLERNLGGIKDMKRLPSAIFVVDPRKESIAVNEALKLGIPVVALIDTNSDPDNIDFVIPGNDDAIRSIRLVSYSIAQAVLTGQSKEIVNNDYDLIYGTEIKKCQDILNSLSVSADIRAGEGGRLAMGYDYTFIVKLEFLDSFVSSDTWLEDNYVSNFNIICHSNKNCVEVDEESWHCKYPLSSRKTVVAEFTVRANDLGSFIVSFDIYHKYKWLQTVEFSMDSYEYVAEIVGEVGKYDHANGAEENVAAMIEGLYYE